MLYFKVFYQRCPTCKQTWAAELSQADVIRIGKEVFVCTCGIAWPTGRVEWAHLTPRMRRPYFLSTAEIGVVILSPLVGALFTFFIARNKWMGLLWGIFGGLAVAAVFLAVMWTLKLMFVILSLRRCPPEPLSTPVGSDFFSLLRDPVTIEADAANPGSEEAGLIAQYSADQLGFCRLGCGSRALD